MITVSPEAETRLMEHLSGEGGEQGALRVYVASGGCSGYSYGMGVDTNIPKEEDEVFTTEKGITVLIDKVSAALMEGAEVDFVDQLMGGGFTINNPNAVKTCGCGHSFQTAEGSGQARACGA